MQQNKMIELEYLKRIRELSNSVHPHSIFDDAMQSTTYFKK